MVSQTKGTRMLRKFMLLIVAAMGTFAGTVLAVGLGEIESKSNLNQALNAEIKLLSAGELSEHEIKASMASQAEFEKLGIEKPFFLNNIKFETYRRDNGELAIKLTSREAIKEPFLNFVVELNWPNGRLLREYTILLDPPIYQDSGGATQTRAQAAPQPARQTRAEPSAPPVRYTAETTQSGGSLSGSTYGPVKESDTLWSIASRARPDSSVSIHQTLVAIYRANPDAFGNGNINNLLKGKVLQIPDIETIRAVPHRAALQDVVMQNRNWRSGGARKIVDRTGGQSRSDNGNADKGARLTLSAVNEDDNAQGYGADGSGDIQQLKSELNRTQEAAATLQAENEELRSRLADALRKLEALQQGAVNIQDEELAALANQDQLVDAGDTENNNADASSEDLALSESDATDTATSDAVPEQADSENINTEVATTDSAAAASDTTEASEETSPPAVGDPVNTFPEPKREESGLLSSPLVWGGGLGVIVLALLALFWYKRKQMEDEEYQENLVSSAGVGPTDTTESFELPDVGDDMLVELDMGDEQEDDESKDEENFDPLGEADIYIAYGKYDEAENLLLDAIDENPVRTDYKVKLMECYAEQENREKFEELAAEVEQAVDADEWMPQVEDLRSRHWGGEAEASDDEFELPSTEDIFGDDDSGSLDEFSFDEEEVSAESESATTEVAEATEEVAQAEQGDVEDEVFDSLDDADEVLDFDDSELDAEIDAELESLDGADALQSDSEEADFDEEFSLDDEPLENIDEADVDEVSLDDDFDLDDEDADAFADEADDEADEITTKLDLARAYIDMGDADGAREILNEVVSEGNEEQKSEAKALLDKIE